MTSILIGLAAGALVALAAMAVWVLLDEAGKPH